MARKRCILLARLAAIEAARGRSTPRGRRSSGRPESVWASGRWRTWPAAPRRTWTRSSPLAPPSRARRRCWAG